MVDSSRAINRVFTRKVMCDLLHGKQNDIFNCVVQQYIHEPESKNHGEIIREIYAHLGKQQRNEYYYINTLLNKLLDGVHNVNTTTAFSQIHIGHSIADFIMINGEGRVYEIKSDLDNFNRLYNQLSDYYRAFSKVSVLTSIHELEKVKQVLSSFDDFGEAVGIYVLSEQSTIFNKERSREPVEFNDRLDHADIFKLLRKREYENVLIRYFGEKPHADPVFQFKICLDYFKKIPILDAQMLAYQEMKKRNNITVKEFCTIQSELKSVIYFSDLTKKIPEFNEVLQTKYRR